MDTRTTLVRLLACAATLGMLCPGALFGQTMPADKAGEGVEAGAGGEQPLSGPRVRDRSAESLVRIDMQGRFQRLEGRPEEAAIDLLTIDPVRRDQARTVIEERSGALRRHLVENIDLIRQSTDAMRAGDSAGTERLSRELHTRFDAKLSRSPLVEPVMKVLSPEEGKEFRRVVEEYWKAWVDIEHRAAPAVPREDLEARLGRELFQREVARAYETTLRPFQQKLDSIYAAVDPTPEQRAAIRAGVIDYIRESQLTPNPALRIKLARTVYDVLDEDRRIRLLAAGLSAL